ncbi:MAG: pilus assembly FimT family protein [Nitrospinota bacterium]
MRHLSVQSATSRGFTLIEMLVVIAIVGILTSIVYFSGSAVLPHKRIDNATNSVKAIIKRARSEAITQSADRALRINPTAETFELKVDLADTTNIQTLDLTGGLAEINTLANCGTSPSASNTMVMVFGSDGSIKQYYQNGATAIPGSFPIVIAITAGGTTDNKEIVIHRAGIAKILDFGTTYDLTPGTGACPS